MKACCKQGYAYPRIIACAGVEFGKVEFVTVPHEREAEALRNPWLEIEQPPAPEPEAVEPVIELEIETEPKQEPVAKKGKR